LSNGFAAKLSRSQHLPAIFKAMAVRQPALLLLAVALGGQAQFTRHPHDQRRWTEGLVCDADRGVVYESTGLFGSSGVIAYRKDGAVLRRFAMPADRFGESLAMDAAGALWQTTYRNGEAFKLNADALTLAASLPIPGANRIQPPRSVGSNSGVMGPLANLVDSGLQVHRFGEALFASMVEDAGNLDAGVGSGAEDGTGESSGSRADAAMPIAEAWGLAFIPDARGGSFILSDGTATLHRLSSDFLTYAGSMSVTFSSALTGAGDPCVPAFTRAPRLNELEFVPGSELRRARSVAAADAAARGLTVPVCAAGSSISGKGEGAGGDGCGRGDELWAAVYQCPYLLRIDACTGAAVGWVVFPRGGGGGMQPGGDSLLEVGEQRATSFPDSDRLLHQQLGRTGASGSTMRSSSRRRRRGTAARAPATDARLDTWRGQAGGGSMASSAAEAANLGASGSSLHDAVWHQTRAHGDLNGIALCAATAGTGDGNTTGNLLPASILLTGKNWDALLEAPLWRVLPQRDVCFGDI